MDRHELQPETTEELLIYWTIVSTWGLWLLGALYVVGPVLGVVLVGLAVARALGSAGDGARPVRVPAGVVIWCLGMVAMLVALVVAHFDFELGLAQTFKSAMGWLKGWALFAMFIVAGALLRVRVEIVYRATGGLALQTLALVPVFYLAYLAGLPADLYVSPLRAIGGPGPEFFDVSLYAINDTSGNVRWRFFAPWSTAAAFLAGIGFVFALYERKRTLQVAGVISAIAVCAMAGSRTSVIALPAIIALVLVISNIRQPLVILGLAVIAAVAVLMADDIAMAYDDATQAFNSARAASSRVRATLASIAYHRWLTEAPVFGHGIVERGPHIVQYMPIGSHHTWNGLLFVKGAVGYLGLAIPLAWSMVELSLKAQTDRVARAGLGLIIALLLFSFGDNLEIVAYLIWPGLIVVGIAMKRRFCSPLGARLGA